MIDKRRFTPALAWAKGVAMRMNFLARPRFALAALMLGGAVGGAYVAQGKGISDHDSNAPVNYAADRIDVLDKQNRVLLAGNVDITQADLRMRAARTLVAYTNDGEVKIQRVDSTGDVVVTRGTETATGDVASYDFNRRIITMVGHVTLRNDRGTSQGERLVIDLDAHHSSFVGGGSTSDAPGAPAAGRVTGSFSVAKRETPKP